MLSAGQRVYAPLKRPGLKPEYSEKDYIITKFQSFNVSLNLNNMLSTFDNVQIVVTKSEQHLIILNDIIAKQKLKLDWLTGQPKSAIDMLAH